MNKEDIIRIAREAGFEQAGHLSYQEITYRFISFAFLVASAEREACAKVCEDYGCAEEMQAIGNDYAQEIRARGQT